MGLRLFKSLSAAGLAFEQLAIAIDLAPRLIGLRLHRLHPCLGLGNQRLLQAPARGRVLDVGTPDLDIRVRRQEFGARRIDHRLELVGA